MDNSMSKSSQKLGETQDECQASCSKIQHEKDDFNSRDCDIRSRVEYFGFDQSYCGYCKLEDESSEQRMSYGMRGKRLLADDYQQLMDLGWRRSGTYCYNPINQVTCCPNYPILCQATQFKISRSQRRCISNLLSYLLNGNISEKVDICHMSQHNDYIKSVDLEKFDILKKSSKARARRFVATCERKVRLYKISLEDAIMNVIKKNYQKHNSVMHLEDYLYPKRSNSPNPKISVKLKHKLEIRLLYVDSQECKSFRKEENELIKRYQKKVHKENESEWSMSRFCGFLVDTPLVSQKIRDLDLKLRANDFFTVDIKINEEYLILKPPHLPTSYGTYHCLYILDEELIAVGVLDVLPKCITTVYFFYEPKYEFLNLGIFSAMVEISLVRQLTKHCTNLSSPLYYHLGYYVHECKKMHYKTRFRPSYLLCSETKEYIPTEVCLKKLRQTKYARFSDDSVSNYDANFESCLTSALEIPVMTPATDLSNLKGYIDWLTANLDSEHVQKLMHCVLQYVRLVGRELSTKMILEIDVLHRILVRMHARKSENC